MSSYQSALKKLKTGQVSPVYLLYGSEQYLQDTFLSSLLDHCRQGQEELDLTRFDLQEDSLTLVLDEANLFSFFADRRVIVVDQADSLIGASRKSITDKEQAALLEYLAQPNEASVLIFRVLKDNLDKRRKLSKALLKEANFVEMTPMDERAVEAYLKEFLRDGKFKIQREGIQELLIRTNYDLTKVTSELNKLNSFANPDQLITKKDISLLVPRSLESNVFELSNAVVALQIEKAVKIYRDLLLLNNNPIQLHALLITQFRLFIQSRILMEAGHLEGDIAKTLSVHPYRVKLALKNNRILSLNQLQQFYMDLVEADFAMKQGLGNKETYFYILLMKLQDMVEKNKS
ncbi:DNA polymerase III subunit delta [Eremococcus coleocola]|uniref:DNA polymerase III subunit delta n=1 Tax=Eremococcus coleocola ACS-139-V-Col8 TaxID=908337 RepID=E4KNZ2_9LACT|nr:DNA polymerase III subunit delta [Eremococcus coleocola]EFR31172.1 DNA polymerase III, delta subunit [Eremococcus coleocola ACS-139-V-Col8]